MPSASAGNGWDPGSRASGWGRSWGNQAASRDGIGAMCPADETVVGNPAVIVRADGRGSLSIKEIRGGRPEPSLMTAERKNACWLWSAEITVELAMMTKCHQRDAQRRKRPAALPAPARRGAGARRPGRQLAESLCKRPRRAETAGVGPKAPSCQMCYICGGEQRIRISLRTRELFGGVQNT